MAGVDPGGGVGPVAGVSAQEAPDPGTGPTPAGARRKSTAEEIDELIDEMDIPNQIHSPVKDYQEKGSAELCKVPPLRDYEDDEVEQAIRGDGSPVPPTPVADVNSAVLISLASTPLARNGNGNGLLLGSEHNHQSTEVATNCFKRSSTQESALSLKQPPKKSTYKSKNAENVVPAGPSPNSNGANDKVANAASLLGTTTKVRKFGQMLIRETKKKKVDAAIASMSWASRRQNMPKVDLSVTVVEARDIGGHDHKDWLRILYPFVLVDVDGQQNLTGVKFKTKNPGWNENFQFNSCELTGRIILQVLDRHAKTKSEQLLGMAQFRILDIVKRARSKPDIKGNVSVNSWFMLKQASGNAVSGQLLVRFELKTAISEDLDDKVDLGELAEEIMIEGDLDQLKSQDLDWNQGMDEEVNLWKPDGTDRNLDVGAGHRYYAQRSLLFFRSEHWFRKWCFDTVADPKFALFSVSIAVASLIMAAIRGDAPGLHDTAAKVEFFIYLCFGMEIVMKVVALGMVGGSGCYLHSNLLNILDLAIFVCFWIEFALPTEAENKFTIRPFRVFRLLLPLTEFSMFDGLKSMTSALARSIPQMASVMASLFIFFICFGIYSMTLFKVTFQRRCVQIVTGEIILPERWCKDDPVHDQCPEDSACRHVGNPNIANFDNIGNTLIALFQTLSQDGQYAVMNTALQGEPEFASLGVAFFIVLAFISRYVLWNQFVAIVTTTFSVVRKEEAANMHNAAETANVAPDLASAEASPKNAGKLMKMGIVSDRLSSPIPGDGRRQSQVLMLQGTVEPISLQQDSWAEFRGPNKKIDLHLVVRWMVEKPLFEVMSMTLIFVNTVLLSMKGLTGDHETDEILEHGVTFVSCFFVVELAMRMQASTSLPSFFRSGKNKFDFVVTSLVFITLWARLLQVSPRRLSVLNSFGSLRLLRLVQHIPSFDQLLNMCLASVTNITNLILFTVASVSIFAICGVFLFGDYPYSQDPRFANFRDYPDAMITLYKITTTDQWRYSLYGLVDVGMQYGNSYDVALAVLFIVGFFCFAQLIIINLYIACIVDNFDISVALEQSGEQSQLSVMKMNKIKSVMKGVFGSSTNWKKKSWWRVFSNLASKPKKADLHIRRKSSFRVDGLGEDAKLFQKIKAQGAHTDKFNAAGIVSPRRGRRPSLQSTGSRIHSPITGVGVMSPIGRSPIQRVHSPHRNFSPTRSTSGASPRRETRVALNDRMSSDFEIEKEEHPHGTDDHEQGGTQPQMGPEDSVTQTKVLQLVLKHVGAQNEEDLLNHVQAMPITGKSFVTQARTSNSKSWLLFPEDHWIRIQCKLITKSYWFYWLLLSNTFLMCVIIGSQPVAESKVYRDTLNGLNMLVVVVYFAEFLVISVADNVLLGEEAYFRSGMHTFHFVLLILGAVDVLGASTRFSQVVRLFRVTTELLSLRKDSSTVSHGMRLVVDGVVTSWKPILMVSFLAFVIATIFANVGQALFRNSLDYCTDSSVVYPMGLVECVGIEIMSESGVVKPRAWTVPDENFENYGRSVMTLFVANTLYVVNVMESAMAITEPGKSPLQNNSKEYCIFFIIYTVIGAFMTMNLFVVFVIDGFNQLRKLEGTELKKKIEFSRFHKLVKKHSPHRQAKLPSGYLPQTVREVVLNSLAFRTFQVLCIFLNTVLMATEHEGQSEEYSSFLQSQNIFFFSVQFLEIGLTIAGIGLPAYLQDAWNIVDFICVSGSTVYVCAGQFEALKTFRSIRVLLVLKAVPSLRNMTERLVSSFSQFFYVMLVMLVVVSVYGIILTVFFHDTREGYNRLGAPVAAWPAEPPNFRNFFVSMYTLFLIAQGQEWHLIMYDTTVQPPYCTPSIIVDGVDHGDCGISFGGSALIFVSFKILAEYVLINLFIGMIMETFLENEDAEIDFYFQADKGDEQGSGLLNEIHRRASVVRKWSLVTPEPESPPPSKVNVKHLKHRISILEAWKECTGGGRDQFLLIRDIKSLFKRLPEPLGYPKDAFGHAIILEEDKSLWKLIQAELNLTVVQRPTEAERAGFLGYRKYVMDPLLQLVGLEIPAPPDTFRVSFDEAFRTIYYWRCLDIVPLEAKAMRLPMYAQVVETAHAVTLARIISRWAAIHRIRKEKGEVSKFEFATLIWAQDNMDLTQDVIRQEKKRTSNGEGGSSGALAMTPTAKDSEFSLRSIMDLSRTSSAGSQVAMLRSNGGFEQD